MRLSIYLYIAGAFILSTVLTWWMRRVAIAYGIIDRPNARSSHSAPVPRGGGIAIVIATTAGVMVVAVYGVVDQHLALALIVGGLAVAWIGFMDDRALVSVRVRLFVHVIAAVWAMYVLGGLPAIQVGSRIVDLGVSGDIVGTILIVWTLNLFNFMDGIDGIAASEAVFVAAFGGGLWLVGVPTHPIFVAGMIFAAACAGFLVWNWPPAKIFMGDVGSGYLGYVIAVVAIASARERPIALFIWLTLGGVFFADATATLLRRLVVGERIHEAHRSHAYQIMARRWNSHRRVTLTVTGINLVMLFPMAWLENRYPTWAWLITLVALTCLTIAVIVAGAGRRAAAGG